jgi:hypothetical protein
VLHQTRCSTVGSRLLSRPTWSFARLARGQIDGAGERLATYLNTARSNLKALGIRRRSRELMGIEEYLRELA